MARSTIYGVLRKAGLTVLSQMERTTRTVIRYERGQPCGPVRFIEELVDDAQVRAEGLVTRLATMPPIR
jgi:hypothetical protein